jgi:hypothetical protein
MTRWAVRLDATNAHHAAALRTMPQVLALEAEGAFWLQGSSLDDAVELRLRSLPNAERFHVDAEGQLIAAGHRIPSGRLPAGSWRPLRPSIPVELPGRVFAGVTEQRLSLQLVRGGTPAEPALLRVPLQAWHDYAVRAPQVRLEHWTFAVSRSSDVLIRGTPLPPLKGERFVEEAGIAVPAGWTWTPAVEATVVREAFGLHPAELALWSADGTWDRIADENFVKATRSAVRLSVEG